MEIFGFAVGPWEVFGFLGNICFGTRFFVQWIASERAKKSVMPVAFWYLSLAGSLILLIYFIHLRSVVGVLAYLPNAIPYSRNLMLVCKERKSLARESDPRSSGDAGTGSGEMGGHGI